MLQRCGQPISLRTMRLRQLRRSFPDTRFKTVGHVAGSPHGRRKIVIRAELGINYEEIKQDKNTPLLCPFFCAPPEGKILRIFRALSCPFRESFVSSSQWSPLQVKAGRFSNNATYCVERKNGVKRSPAIIRALKSRPDSINSFSERLRRK